jgi:hypothetical protein
MQHAASVTVPADTQESTPVTQEFLLTAGRLTRAYIRFRSGCHNRVFVTVSDSLFQIVPIEGSPAIFGDDQIFEIPMDYPLEGPGARLTVRAWSPGTLYQHVIGVWFDVIEDEARLKTDFIAMLQHLESQ